MKLKRIGPLSAFVVNGTFYALIGLLVGLVFSVLALVGAGVAGVTGEDAGEAFVGALFGIGAVIALPLLYGFMGAISGAVMALLYNLIAAITGGLEVELGS